MTYYSHICCSTGEDAHCSSVKVNRSDLFPFWGWLANAMYIGNEVIEHKEMALWEDEVICIMKINIL